MFASFRLHIYYSQDDFHSCCSRTNVHIGVVSPYKVTVNKIGFVPNNAYMLTARSYKQWGQWLKNDVHVYSLPEYCGLHNLHK